MLPPLPGPDERSPIAADFLARWQARLLVSQRRSGLQGAEGTRTDLELAPHQARTVLEVLSAPRVRHVLADEVGMGKTIEALMVYQALRVERPRLWTMILVPGHLGYQWLGEIYLRAHRVFALATGGKEEALDPEVAQDLLLDREWLASSEDGRRRLLEGFGGRANAQRPRLLIVDEAHRLAPPVYALVQDLARKVENVLLLTATPVELEAQGGADQLRYEQLLRLLDPDLTDEGFAKLRAREADVVRRFEGSEDEKDLLAASGLAAWRVLRHRRADAPRVFKKRVFHRHAIAGGDDAKLAHLKDLIAKAWREDRQAG
ncbi:MAG TPA: SNF2-related protein, partial [Planctomycetota bacterium]|nr:SNF2-related protein [Planctomycetota bacterium]